MTITIQELQALREEFAAKQREKQDLENELADLENELARLQGLEPGVEPPAAIIEKPFYKRWSFWAGAGTLTAIIAGVAAWKRKKK